MKRTYILGFLVVLLFNLLLIGCSTLNNASAPADTNQTDKTGTTQPATYCVDNTSWDMILYLPGIEDQTSVGHASYSSQNQVDPDYKVVDSNNFKFVENTNGTAKLSGEVRFVNGSDRGFQVEVNLSGKTTTGTPKFSDDVPSSTDTSNWYYYPTYTGTLTGVGTYEGMKLSISNADGEPIQVGTGANLVDASDLGLYIWTEYQLVNQGTSVNAPNSGEADFHIKLISCPAVKASLGNRAWLDSNGNGLQDDGEEGLAGVKVDLYDGNGNFIASETTDANGNYLFSNLDAGNYSLDITLPNSNQSFTLQNQGDNDAADSDVNPNDGTVTGITLSAGENDLDWDIGVKDSGGTTCSGTGSIGDFVWNDLNRDGMQDDGEHGIDGVVLDLYKDDNQNGIIDAGENVAHTATTANGGLYSFDDICVDFAYILKLKEENFAAGKPLEDFEETYKPPFLSILLYKGANLTLFDFGYAKPQPTCTGSIGQDVWEDNNNNGLQDNGESGIAGVKVKLLDNNNNVLATDTTDSQGIYKFDNLCAGNYQIDVDENTLPANMIPTQPNQGTDDDKDSDGPLNGDPVSVILLNNNSSDSSIDFGYIHTGCKSIPEIDGEFIATWQMIGINSGVNTKVISLSFHWNRDELFGGLDTNHKVVSMQGDSVKAQLQSDFVGDLQEDLFNVKTDGSTFDWAQNPIVSGRDSYYWITFSTNLPQPVSSVSNTLKAYGVYEFIVTLENTEGNQYAKAFCLDINHLYVVTPIALDLNRDGKIGVTGATSSFEKDPNAEIGRTVEFDIDADGELDTIEWFDGSGDGILVDTSKIGTNNEIDGSALFGDEGGKFANGYEKLATFDDDNDQLISGSELEGLGLWVDDGDAVLEDSELVTVSKADIVSISTEMKIARDEENRPLMQSLATTEDGEEILTEDVWFMSK